MRGREAAATEAPPDSVVAREVEFRIGLGSCGSHDVRRLLARRLDDLGDLSRSVGRCLVW